MNGEINREHILDVVDHIFSVHGFYCSQRRFMNLTKEQLNQLRKEREDAFVEIIEAYQREIQEENMKLKEAEEILKDAVNWFSMPASELTPGEDERACTWKRRAVEYFKGR